MTSSPSYSLNCADEGFSWNIRIVFLILCTTYRQTHTHTHTQTHTHTHGHTNTQIHLHKYRDLHKFDPRKYDRNWVVYRLHFKVSIASSDTDLIMAHSTIFLAVMVLIATSLVLCEEKGENADQHKVRVHHRVRRMNGYRQKCVPLGKNLCTILTHSRITKPFRFVQIRDIEMVEGLDILNIVHDRVQGKLALKNVKPRRNEYQLYKLTPKEGVLQRNWGPKIWKKFPRNSVGVNILNNFRNKLEQMWGN